MDIGTPQLPAEPNAPPGQRLETGEIRCGVDRWCTSCGQAEFIEAVAVFATSDDQLSGSFTSAADFCTNCEAFWGQTRD